MGRDFLPLSFRRCGCISIHAPRVGRDVQLSYRRNRIGKFQSTRPVWGATLWRPFYITSKEFQSTRPVWGATKSSESNYSLERISIHAPRVGRDITPLVRNGGCRNFNPRAPCGARPVWAAMPRGILRDFNPRAPCGARRRSSRREWQHRTTFQSTRPVWGATRSPTWRSCSSRYFNPRAPCGARHGRRADHQLYRHFNPRAPCGARPRMHRQLSLPSIFQSTRPVWGATLIERYN